ncbi:helix-turn-helix domain-containing protein [Brevibacillus daliensis]|uniref:helix-turn-helix domain-containing protein n=1 Tax=Brevibacillus daliensis TaxID=2892995 RepID=UPI001E462EB2|nr:RodZ domain-containing protein [Brevibacillus daliensis]
MSELGQVLKRAREEKGISLEEIQKMTKIQTRYLEAIERGHFHFLPGHFYARAFIKSYAEAVGLDSTEILEQYQSELPAQPAPEQVERLQRRNVVKRRMPIQTGRWVAPTLVILFVVLVAGLIYVAVVNGNQTAAPPVKPSDQTIEKKPGEGLPPTPPQTTPPVTTPGTVPGTTPDPNLTLPGEEGGASTVKLVEEKKGHYTFEVAQADKISLTVKTTGSSWVRVRDKAGKNLYESTMKEGQEQVVEAGDTAILRTGNSRALQIMVNNTPIDMSQVKDQTTNLEFKLAPTTGTTTP